ncbi:hypothetical protein BSL78_21323 [Apostichopus japonicus]|uniref:Uncharacterized protein n=1 Tax=Stichopus japonicus TaxID=307972 RepID=A0A2G8K1E9_STIJA|nr:hypothetical protein BSL78_21323 [Apostichopus japonicus]
MSSHTVSTKQFIERRVPEWNSSNISTSFNKQTGRMATPQYLTSSSTLHRKEMSPIIDHPDSCHRKSESSQKVPSLSQRSSSCVTEMSLPDVQPVHIFSQTESMVVSPQCVPCISPVIETEETSVVCNNEEFDSQIEHLRWLEGDNPLLSETSRIVNGTPMVAKVDSFSEEQSDVLVCPREKLGTDVPLVDNSTKNAATD